MYKKLKQTVEKELIYFKEDLEIDIRRLKKNKSPFIYGYRQNGTNLFFLDDSVYDYSDTQESIFNILDTQLHSIIYSNKKFLYRNEETLHEVSVDTIKEKFADFKDEVARKKNKIDSLKIKALAYTLYETMVKNQKQWKSIVKTSNVAELRRIRNHFDFFQIRYSEDVYEIENQLYKYIM